MPEARLDDSGASEMAVPPGEGQPAARGTDATYSRVAYLRRLARALEAPGLWR